MPAYVIPLNKPPVSTKKPELLFQFPILCREEQQFVDAIICNQAFQNERCHICFILGLDEVETGGNLFME